MSKNKNKFIQKIGSDEDIEVYLPRLNTIGNISKKMKKLYQMSRLSKNDIDNRQRILDYIRSLFLPFYPDCILVVFGSTINGFGTSGCDMDLMFYPSADYKHLDTSEDDDNEDAPTVRDVRGNPSLMAKLKNMSQAKQLRFLLRVLRCDKNRIQNAVYIPAKCRILRFSVSHNYSLWCDLSFQHGLAKYNTELLRYFSSLDYRIKPLMITLRFWARHFKIVNTGSLSSYAFTLLVIFFLQNLEDPILPPVADLMINAESNIVDGWEAGFVADGQQNFKSKNSLSKEELLKEFFRFYWNFNFGKFVVCTRTGKATPVSDIKKDNDERMKQFKISDVCVQDPLKLSHNVACSLNISKIHLLKPYFFIADLILSKQSQSLPKDAFHLLFERGFYEDKIIEHFSIYGSDVFDCFHMYPNREVITGMAEKFEKVWVEQVSQAVRDILVYIFYFDSEVIDKDCLDKDTDSESQKKHGKLLSSIQCVVDNKVYKYRSTKAKKDVPSNFHGDNFSNEILKEYNALSHFLMTTTPGIRGSPPYFMFLCNIYQSKYSQIPYIKICLKPYSESPEFPVICKVLKNFVPSTVQKMLLCQCV